MSIAPPTKPNLEQPKHQAKDLLHARLTGEAQAWDRLKADLPRLGRLNPIGLAGWPVRRP
jgi:hypothetical protein